MYIEFFILIIDYFKTIKVKIFIYEWLFPLIICLAIYFNFDKMDMSSFKSFKESTLNILGVLLGFSIAIITLIITTSNNNISTIKVIQTKFQNKSNTQLSLFELILVNFTYTVTIEIFVIISSLLFPLLSHILYFSANLKLILYSFLVFFVIHILLITLRNITDLYLILTKKTNN